MTAAVYNIVIEPFAVFTLAAQYKAAGVGVDLTGWQAGFQVTDNYGDAVIDALTATTENGGITLDAQGNVNVKVPAQQTALVTITSGFYDLRLIPPSGPGDAIRLLQGKVKVNPAVDTVA